MKLFQTLMLAAATTLPLGSPVTAGGHEAIAAETRMDIVDFASHTGQFDTLVRALEATGLTETLRSDGPFTLFAPTDDAFARIPRDELETLLADRERLTSVLTYHVVRGRVMAAQVAELDSAETVQGQSVTVDASDGVRVDSARIVHSDLEVSNGVVHVIDTVIAPRS